MSKDQFNQMVMTRAFVCGDGLLVPIPLDVLVGVWKPRQFIFEISFELWERSCFAVMSKVICVDLFVLYGEDASSGGH